MLRNPPVLTRLRTRRAGPIGPAFIQQPGVPAHRSAALSLSKLSVARLSVNVASILPLLPQVVQPQDCGQSLVFRRLPLLYLQARSDSRLGGQAILAPALSQQPEAPSGVGSSIRPQQGPKGSHSRLIKLLCFIFSASARLQYCSLGLSVILAPFVLQFSSPVHPKTVVSRRSSGGLLREPSDHSRLQTRRAGHTDPSPQPAARGTNGSSPQHSASARLPILLASAQRQCSHSCLIKPLSF